MFQAARIDYMKLGPSATKIQQPADAADGFRDAKTGVKKVSQNSVMVHNVLLRNNMVKCFNNLAIKFPELQITSACKDKIMHALEVITHVLRQSYMTGFKFSEGFRRTGQLVDCLFPLAPNTVTVSYDCMISKCLNKELTVDDIQNMKAQLPVAAIRAIEQGIIS